MSLPKRCDHGGKNQPADDNCYCANRPRQIMCNSRLDTEGQRFQSTGVSLRHLAWYRRQRNQPAEPLRLRIERRCDHQRFGAVLPSQ